MDSKSTQDPRSSVDERRALLPQHYEGEKGNIFIDKTVVCGKAPPGNRRWRIFMHHLKISFCVVAAFLLIVLFKHHIFRGFWRTGTSRHPQTNINSGWPPNAPAMCDETSSADYKFEFDHPGQFRFEEIFDLDHVSVRYVHSEIRLQPATEDAPKDVTTSIVVTTNQKDVIEALQYDKSDSELVFKVVVPRGTRNLCLNIEADVFIKPGIKLSTLGIFSNVASFEMLAGLESIEIDETTVHVDVGSIAGSPLNSRKTRIDNGAGSVSGTYNLLDLLSVHTITGSVHIDVLPQEASKSDPQPAELVVASKSGSIGVAFPPVGADIPEREYRTYVNAVAGSISGNYIHGDETDITTRSGSVQVSILPYAADQYASALTTRSDLGRQDITLLSPYTGTGEAIKSLNSSHFSHAGSLHLEYPAEWEGSIEGSTKVGSLRLEGRDVQVIEKGGYGPVGHWVKAIKGKGGSKLRFGSQTGSLDVEIGTI